jgi:rRNA-processing protein FCF1
LPIKVLLDTSILLTSLKIPFDIFGETEKLLQAQIEFLVLEQVQEELERLSKKRTSLGVRAAHALEITAELRILSLSPAKETTTDEALVRASKDVKAIVATADSRLRKKLRALNVPVLTLRGNRLYCEPETPEYWPSML